MKLTNGLLILVIMLLLAIFGVILDTRTRQNRDLTTIKGDTFEIVSGMFTGNIRMPVVAEAKQ